MNPPNCPWDRLPDNTESAKAYDAFCAYRDRGAGRSLSEAYRQKTGRKQAGQPSGEWNAWYGAHRWKERAEAYDAYLERRVRAQAEADHLQNLRDFQDRKRKLAIAAANMSTRMMSIVQKRLTALDKLKDEELADALPIALIPQLIRASVSSALAANQSEAEALAVEDILKSIQALPEIEEDEPPAATTHPDSGGETVPASGEGPGAS